MTGCLPAQEWEIRTPNHRLIFDIIKFLASAWRTKGTGGIPTGAEPHANRFSPARMLLFGPNSAPNSGQISPIEMLAVPGVRIRPSPPYSLYYLPTIWRWRQIRAGRGAFALNANRRKLSRCRLDEFQGYFLHAKKKRVASGVRTLSGRPSPSHRFSEKREARDLNRARVRLAAPTIRAASRSG